MKEIDILNANIEPLSFSFGNEYDSVDVCKKEIM